MFYLQYCPQIAFESFKTSTNGSVAIDYINITRSYRKCDDSFLSHQTVNVCPTMTTQAPSSTTLKSVTCETIGRHGNNWLQSKHTSI